MTLDQRLEIIPINLGWRDQIAQLSFHGNTPSLIIFNASCSDEDGYSLAESVRVEGDRALKALRDALNTAFPLENPH